MTDDIDARIAKARETMSVDAKDLLAYSVECCNSMDVEVLVAYEEERQRLLVGENAMRPMLVEIFVEAIKGASDAAIIADQQYDANHVLAAVRRLARVARADRNALARAIRERDDARVAARILGGNEYDCAESKWPEWLRDALADETGQTGEFDHADEVQS